MSFRAEEFDALVDACLFSFEYYSKLEQYVQQHSIPVELHQSETGGIYRVRMAIADYTDHINELRALKVLYAQTLEAVEIYERPEDIDFEGKYFTETLDGKPHLCLAFNTKEGNKTASISSFQDGLWWVNSDLSCKDLQEDEFWEYAGCIKALANNLLWYYGRKILNFEEPK